MNHEESVPPVPAAVPTVDSGSAAAEPSQIPRWPKLLEDYAGAALRLVTARINEQPYVLMAYVELYPHDIPVPDTFRVGNKPWTVPNFALGATIAVSATRVSVSEALTWYEACAVGQVGVPGAPTIRPLAPSLGAEPKLGSFCVPQELPFKAPWHGRPRVHRLVPMSTVDAPVRQLAGSKQAGEWLADNFGFNPLAHEEWLGSVSLIAPDPLLQSVDYFIQGSKVDGSERVIFRATRRRYPGYPSADADDLSVVLLERRPGGWSQVEARKIGRDGYSIVDHDAPLSEAGYAVSCPTRGLLRMYEPAHWIGNVSLGLGVVDSVLDVEVASGGRRKPAIRYLAHQVRDAGAMSVGEALGTSGATRLARLQSERAERSRIQGAPQRLFGIVQAKEDVTEEELARGRQQAEDYVFELVKVARKRVIFVDPDWGLRETQYYAFRVQRVGATVTVLTSVRPLTDEPPKRRIEGPGQQEISELQELVLPKAVESLEYLKRVNEQAPNCPISVFVMPGAKNKTAFHDRFLVIDDEVWACGPSFNELGERIGLISRVHAPEPIIEAIEEVLARSPSLADWAKRFDVPPSAKTQ